MLILTRKSREAVVVGEHSGNEQLLKVTVLEVRGSSVKLGFEADDTVPIHRAEVWDRIRAENGAAEDQSFAPQPGNRLPYID